jgi:RimJ/RimL family protein N-acetyltransferase
MEERDLATVNQLFWDPDVTEGVGAGFPEPLSGTRAFWERATADPTMVLFAIETLEGRELVGACSLDTISARNRSAVLGIWIGRPYWDRGFGTDAVRALCRLGFRQLNLHRVGLTVYASNPRARRAYEKVGFREEGRAREAHFLDGSYVDEIHMGLLDDELVEEGEGA